MKRFFTLALILAGAVGIAGAEVLPWSPGVPGLMKADVDLLLTLNGEAVSDAAVTLVEIGAEGDYEIRGLPDAAVGEGDLYWVRVEYLGDRLVYAWPQSTRTPQSVVFRVNDTPVPGVWQMGTGDTAIPGQLVITGLAADPTGSTVTFSMRKSSGGAAVVDAEAATLSDVDQVVDPVTSEVTWTATVTYDFTATDTATAGEYRGWFVLTFPSGGITTRPPQRDIKIRIF